MIGEGPARLTDEDVVDVARHVSELAGAGLALPPGLRALGEELPRGALRRSLIGLAEAMERGDSFDEAMEAQGRRFPGHLRGLVRAGVRTGRLGDVLGKFVDYERVGADLRRRLWLNLVYPILLLAALGAAFSFIAWVVVDGFEKIMADFGIDLPVISIMLIKVSHAIHRAGWGVFFGPLVVVAVIWIGAGGWLGTPWKRRLASGVPMIGPLWRWSALAEFSHLLGLLVESEVPLPEALGLAGEGVRDSDLAHIARRVAAEVEAGGSMAEGLTRWRIYPRAFAKLLDWAHVNRALPDALHMIGETFEARARAQAVFVGIFFTVAAVILAIFGVVLAVLGLYLPLIQLIARLSG